MDSDQPQTAPPFRTTPAAPPQQIFVQQRSRALGCFGWLLLLGALMVMILVSFSSYISYHSYFNPSNGPQEKFHSLSREATKKIAIISLDGVILEADGFVKQQIDRVRDDPDVVAVVLRVDSPGGTVTASNYLYHHLRQLVDDRQLPLVVSMGSLCASGGYYVAMAVGDQKDAVFAEQSTWTGSIGVIIPHFDLSGAMQSLNIKDDSIVSGPLKEMGSPTRPMSDRERAVLQGLVDDSFQSFKDIVVSGRPELKGDAQALAEVTTGQVFSANQALANGLIDRIGFVDEAIERAAELSGESTDNLRCVKYEKPPSLLDELTGVQSSARGGIDAQAWLDLTAPRAYYLWTWLPTLLTNTRP
jgi:protease-4